MTTPSSIRVTLKPCESSRAPLPPGPESSRTSCDELFRRLWLTTPPLSVAPRSNLSPDLPAQHRVVTLRPPH